MAGCGLAGRWAGSTSCWLRHRTLGQFFSAADGNRDDRVSFKEFQQALLFSSVLDGKRGVYGLAEVGYRYHAPRANLAQLRSSDWSTDIHLLCAAVRCVGATDIAVIHDVHG